MAEGTQRTVLFQPVSLSAFSTPLHASIALSLPSWPWTTSMDLRTERNWGEISRLILNHFAPEESYNCCAVVDTSLGVDKILCFRADRSRLEFYFRHCVILSKLLSPSGPQFPQL